MAPVWLFACQILFLQNIYAQIVPLNSGCACQKPALLQTPVISYPTPPSSCNCNNRILLNNLQAPGMPIVNNLPNLNNIPVLAQLNGQAANIPFNNFAFGNLPAINQLPLTNIPNFNSVNFLPKLGLNSLPVIANLPIGQNVPILNNVPVLNNIANGNKLYNNPFLNSFLFNNLQIPNKLPFVNNLRINNLQYNLPKYYQVANNAPAVNIPSQNSNLLPVNRIIQPNNFVTSQNQNMIIQNQNPVKNQFQSCPLANLAPVPVAQRPIAKECNCNQGVAVIVENDIVNPVQNQAAVSMNGLQLGGVGGFGSLPLFNGLPVIGVSESVVKLNPPCNCQN